jgi:hypothetical protein
VIAASDPRRLAERGTATSRRLRPPGGGSVGCRATDRDERARPASTVGCGPAPTPGRLPGPSLDLQRLMCGSQPRVDGATVTQRAFAAHVRSLAVRVGRCMMVYRSGSLLRALSPTPLWNVYRPRVTLVAHDWPPTGREAPPLMDFWTARRSGAVTIRCTRELLRVDVFRHEGMLPAGSAPP